MPDETNNNDATRPVSINPDKTQPNSPSPVDTTLPVNVGKSIDPASDGNEDPLSEAPEMIGEQPEDEVAEDKPKSWRGRVILAGILIVLLLGALGGFMGYRSGLQSRVDHQSSQVAAAAATQFQLGLDDMNNGRYEMARGRFEYVINLDPSFPGAVEKLTEVMILLIPTTIPTATLTPTPEFTPTPDTRGEQELYKQIQQNLVDKKWDEAISNIESLRSKNLGYETVAVDGFYYIALHNRGVDKILSLGDLEGGMYDLALTARFGPLDRDAESYQVWARYYVTGASFWEVDWEKATYYFNLVAPYLPNLRDASNIFAIDRYRQAAIHYAQQLLDGDDACKAEEVLKGVLVNNYTNSTVEPLATEASRKCHPATKTPTPPASLSETPTETPTPSETPTLGATDTTPQPTQTNTTAPSASAPTDTATVPAPTATNTPVPPTATTAAQPQGSTDTPTTASP